MRVTINPVEWAVDRLFDHYPNLTSLFVTDQPQMSPREWVRGRINWGIERRLTWFCGDQYGPTGVILIRPVTHQLIETGDQDYWAHVFDYEPSGDICFVDFAYGPGCYGKFIRLCKRTGKEWICYRHKQKLRLVRMADMPG